jgi:hypothetical protein
MKYIKVLFRWENLSIQSYKKLRQKKILILWLKYEQTKIFNILGFNWHCLKLWVYYQRYFWSYEKKLENSLKALEKFGGHILGDFSRN